MEATKLLIEQHEEVSELFDKIEKASGQKARALVERLAKNLLAHMIIEQTIFYPVAVEAERDRVLEGYEEHAVARRGLESLIATQAGDETFKAKAEVLRELIEHHVDEEQKEMFPKVRKAFDKQRLELLGARMEQAFDALVDKPSEQLLRDADALAELADVRRSRRKKRGGPATVQA